RRRDRTSPGGRAARRGTRRGREVAGGHRGDAMTAAAPETEPARAVLERAMSRGPRCGDVTVVLVDGPAGSGKTTLAGRLEEAAETHEVGCAVVHMDDLYAGWEGLRAGGEALTTLLHALAAGEPASYRRYDWA